MTAIPSDFRWSAGPMPESIISLGEPIAPAVTNTSRSAVAVTLVSGMTVVARRWRGRSRITTRDTWQSVWMVRFFRSWTGLR